MVRWAVKPSRLNAVCCSVLVMKGARGCTWRGWVSTVATRAGAPASSAASVRARSPAPGPRSCCCSSSSSPTRTRRAVKRAPSGVSKSASSVQYSSGRKARISSSRSQTRRSATLCTRPALRPK